MTSLPPPAPAEAALPQPAAPRRAVSLRQAFVWLVGVALVLACALAYGLATWAGAGALVWVAPLAAGVGVLAAAWPLGLLAARMSGAVPAGTLPAPLLPNGLPREQFLDLAGREWARARRYGTGAALLVVEVDRFTRLLETHGAAATDAVLVELLQHTAPTLRGADVLTRFSESQMAVFLAPADATGALDVAERLRERAEHLEVSMPPQRLRFTVSVGVAHLRPAHLNLQALVDDAGDAVLAARQAGGNCVRAAPVETSRQPTPGKWINDHGARPP